MRLQVHIWGYTQGSTHTLYWQTVSWEAKLQIHLHGKSHDVKDTVDSAPFNCGAGCYGRDGEYCEYDDQVANDDHEDGLPIAGLKERREITGENR